MSVAVAKSQYHRALHLLREMIFCGDLAAGTDHLEVELADRLGMSRTPVREALLTLDSQGLVQVRPRRGVRIVPVSSDDMCEIYDILIELESLAAEQVASRGCGAADLTELRAAVDAMERALLENDLPSWAAADDQFHVELVRLGGNSRLHAIVGQMHDQVRRARAATLYIRPTPTQSNEAHRAVLDAIATGDGQAARTLHRAHRQAAKATILALLARHQLKGL